MRQVPQGEMLGKGANSEGTKLAADLRRLR